MQIFYQMRLVFTSNIKKCPFSVEEFSKESAWPSVLKHYCTGGTGTNIWSEIPFFSIKKLKKTGEQVRQGKEKKQPPPQIFVFPSIR